jgi:glycosyltransferase involved in cell wall biosynthesis
MGYPAGPERSGERKTTSSFTAGYLGRLEANKGVDTLLEAAADCPGVQIRVGGDGPERRSLEAIAALAADRVVFTGRVAHEDVGAFLSGLDVLVLPSRSMPGWKEQFGRVLVEAMSRGVIPIGSATGAIPEVIGDAGFTFPEGDALALAGILNDLQSRESLEELRRRAMDRACTWFSDERIARGYAAVIEHLFPAWKPVCGDAKELVWV